MHAQESVFPANSLITTKIAPMGWWLKAWHLGLSSDLWDWMSKGWGHLPCCGHLHRWCLALKWAQDACCAARVPTQRQMDCPKVPPAQESLGFLKGPAFAAQLLPTHDQPRTRHRAAATLQLCLLEGEFSKLGAPQRLSSPTDGEIRTQRRPWSSSRSPRQLVTWWSPYSSLSSWAPNQDLTLPPKHSLYLNFQAHDDVYWVLTMHSNCFLFLYFFIPFSKMSLGYYLVSVVLVFKCTQLPDAILGTYFFFNSFNPPDDDSSVSCVLFSFHTVHTIFLSWRNWGREMINNLPKVIACYCQVFMHRIKCRQSGCRVCTFNHYLILSEK